MSNTIALMFVAVTQTFNLPPGLLSGLCFVESSHVASATHFDDGHGTSIGICQIKLPTARLLGFEGSETSLKDPYTNIYFAGAYLHRQLLRYSGDLLKAVAAYNSGTYRPDPKAKGKPRNQVYVKKVFKAWRAGR